MQKVEEFLWVEKYRPRTIEDCILPPSIKTYFQDMVDKGSLQNMLLVGSPGTGKTTVAKALCNELNVDYLVINASENGNIDTLRTTIRSFASSVSLQQDFKVVILDEADYLNANSTQPALRNFIEEFSKNCRFIMTANYENRIIDPLKSRCAVITFGIPKEDKQKIVIQLDRRMKKILADEAVEYDPKLLAQIILKFFPDFRKIINELQRNSTSGTLSVAALRGMSEDAINQLFTFLKDPKKWSEMRKWVAENTDSDTSLIIRALYENASKIMQPSSMPQLVLTLAEYDYKGGFVVDKEIHTVAMLTEIMSNSEWK
jgi:DNA polymerase III delta prime subunit